MDGVEVVLCTISRDADIAAELKDLFSVDGLVIEIIRASTQSRDDGSSAPAYDIEHIKPIDVESLSSRIEHIAHKSTLTAVLIVPDVLSARSPNGGSHSDLFQSSLLSVPLLVALERAISGHEMDAETSAEMSKLHLLTPREHEVLRHLIAGETSKEIARRLGTSPRTVEVHRAKILAKLSARNVAEAVRIALDANRRSVA